MLCVNSHELEEPYCVPMQGHQGLLVLYVCVYGGREGGREGREGREGC